MRLLKQNWKNIWKNWCQTFSRVGLQEGFDDEEKGKIFFHISEIIQKTRPFVIFLENVDRLVTHDEGRTFRTIIDTLEHRTVDPRWFFVDVNAVDKRKMEVNEG